MWHLARRQVGHDLTHHCTIQLDFEAAGLDDREDVRRLDHFAVLVDPHQCLVMRDRTIVQVDDRLIVHDQAGTIDDRIVDRGYVDTFRSLYPDTVKYSWWSYRFNARKTNAGWRIDYFFTSKNLFEQEKVSDAWIDNEIYGSDHCPVGLALRMGQ
jgi:exonuclease III